jgi:hypothetical protein
VLEDIERSAEDFRTLAVKSGKRRFLPALKKLPVAVLSKLSGKPAQPGTAEVNPAQTKDALSEESRRLVSDP